jgi:integrase/recombinase XerD
MKGKTRAYGEEPVSALSKEQLVQLLLAARKRGARDHLLLALSYRFGLRVGEAIRLELQDVDLGKGEVLVRALKGGLVRRYALPRELSTLVRRWLKVRGPQAGSFFTGRQGGLTRQRCLQVVKACAEEAGLPTAGENGVRFHTLRHSIGVHMLDARMPLESVKDLLRHSSIRSTERYAKTSQARLGAYQREMDRAPEIVKVGR